MADVDVTNIVLIATFFVIFGVFLFFDLFKRNEKYSYLAYIIVLLPINYLWVLSAFYANITSLTVFLIWFILLDVCLVRDLIFIYRKTKEFDDVILFLLLGMFVQLIISAIIPNALPALKDLGDTSQVLIFFYLPDVWNTLYYGTSLALAFKIVATLLIILAIAPLIIDIKDEEVPLPIVVLISVIFYLPFLFLGYLWLGFVAMWVVAFLMSVVLFILLLIITKSS